MGRVRVLAVALAVLLLPLPHRAVHPELSPGSAWSLSGRLLADGRVLDAGAGSEVLVLAAGRPQLLGERVGELLLPGYPRLPSRRTASSGPVSQSAVASGSAAVAARLRCAPPAGDVRFVFPSQRFDLMRFASGLDLGPSSSLSMLLLFLADAGMVSLPPGRVAASGVLRADGTVGRVSGLAAKAEAASRAGAVLLLVPAGQEGSFAAPSGVRVVPVADVSELLRLFPPAASVRSC